jgi:hypothetical protein
VHDEYEFVRKDLAQKDMTRNTNACAMECMVGSTYGRGGGTLVT